MWRTWSAQFWPLSLWHAKPRELTCANCCPWTLSRGVAWHRERGQNWTMSAHSHVCSVWIEPDSRLGPSTKCRYSCASQFVTALFINTQCLLHRIELRTHWREFFLSTKENLCTLFMTELSQNPCTLQALYHWKCPKGWSEFGWILFQHTCIAVAFSCWNSNGKMQPLSAYTANEGNVYSLVSRFLALATRVYYPRVTGKMFLNVTTLWITRV